MVEINPKTKKYLLVKNKINVHASVQSKLQESVDGSACTKSGEFSRINVQFCIKYLDMWRLYRQYITCIKNISL